MTLGLIPLKSDVFKVEKKIFEQTNLLHSVYSANTICKNYTPSLSVELW